jgi:PAS domain S-box-containing protein
MHVYAAPGASKLRGDSAMDNLRWSRIPSIRDKVKKGPYFGLVEKFPVAFRRILKERRILSLAMVPVYVSDGWFGFIGFDDCEKKRKWSEWEIEALQTAAGVLGAAIEKRGELEDFRSILVDAIDSLGSGLFILDKECRVVWINRKMEEFFGINRNQLIGKDKRKFIREEIRDIIVDHRKFKSALLATYKNNSYIEQFKCEVKPGRNRRRRILQHWSTPVKNGAFAGGRVEHYIDITNVERAHAALRLSEEKYRSIVENMNEGLAYVDENGVIRYANPSLFRMTGYSPAEILGRRIEEFVTEEGLGRLEDGRRLLRGGGTYRVGFEIRGRDGEMIPIQASASPVFDERNRFRGAYTVITDFRERRKLERIKDDILREASHELLAPTAKMVMAVEMIKKGRHLLSRDQLFGVGMIDKEVRRMRHNIETITDLSAFDAGQIRLKKRKTELYKLLDEVSSDCIKGVEKKDICLRCVKPRRPVYINCDRERSYILFRNLVDNAIKFTDKGEIRVSLRRKREELVVAVKDEGRGLEPEYQSLMFDKHFQRYSSDAGAGLGLTLCKKIAGLHGWSVYTKSAGRGKGMTAFVIIPLHSNRKGKGKLLPFEKR